MATPRREALGQGSDPSHERMYNPVSNTVSGQLGGTGEGFLQGRMVWEGPGLEVKGTEGTHCVCRCFCQERAGGNVTTVVMAS